MKHIDLKRTHRLLYRLAWVKASFAIFLSLGVILLPQILIKESSLPDNLLSATAWGILWLIAGGTIAYGLIRKYYDPVRVGLVALCSLYFMFAIGAVFTAVFGEGNYSMFIAVVFLTKSIICALILGEPPINPSTAVKEGQDE